jgi:hypothetical protein
LFHQEGTLHILEVPLRKRWKERIYGRANRRRERRERTMVSPVVRQSIPSNLFTELATDLTALKGEYESQRTKLVTLEKRIARLEDRIAELHKV